MDDRFNTASGWVLFSGIIALGGTIVSGMYYEAGKPHQLEEGQGGYYVEDVDGGPGGDEAELPIGNILAMGDVATGQQQAAARCGTCHSFDQGGANGQGPNLYGIMGKSLGKVGGFNYSSALAEKGGDWTWEAMNAWLKAPKSFIPGTSMGFAGLKDDAARASIMLYLNSLGSNLTVPPPVDLEAEAPADDAAAEDTPVVTETEDTPEAEAPVPTDQPATANE